MRRDKPCHYCRTPNGGTLDHIVPLSRGGLNRPWNKVVACPECNQLKADDLPFASRLEHWCRTGKCQHAYARWLAGERKF